MLPIFRRELKGFFTGFIGYVFIACILLFAGIYTTIVMLQNALPNFEYVLSNMNLVFVVAIPVITMRTTADERRQNTDKLLFSMPVSVTQIVLGKYFAMLAVLAVPMALMALYPVLLSAYGTIYVLSGVNAVIGFFFMGAALLAVGMFASSVTDNQAVAALLSFAVMLVSYLITFIAGDLAAGAFSSFAILTLCAAVAGAVFWFMTKNAPASIGAASLIEIAMAVIYIIRPGAFENLFPELVARFSLFERFGPFSSGAFDLGAVVYYISLSALFLYMTVRSFDKRRWK